MNGSKERPMFRPWAAWLSYVLGQLSMRVYLHALYIYDARVAESASIDVYVSNHISRYDGFALQLVQRKYRPGGRLFTIVLKRQFGTYSIFRLGGAFRIVPGSMASGRDLLHLIKSELRPGDSVSIFPQGEIFPQDKSLEEVHSGFLQFQKAGASIRYIPVALAIEPLQHARPSLFVRVGQSVAVSDEATNTYGAVVQSMESNNRELRERLKRFGERSPQVWDGFRVF